MNMLASLVVVAPDQTASNISTNNFNQQNEMIIFHQSNLNPGKMG